MNPTVHKIHKILIQETPIRVLLLAQGDELLPRLAQAASNHFPAQILGLGEQRSAAEAGGEIVVPLAELDPARVVRVGIYPVAGEDILVRRVGEERIVIFAQEIDLREQRHPEAGALLEVFAETNV